MMKTLGTVTALLVALGFVFAQNQTGGVRVSGRITGIPTDGPPGWLRVTLSTTNGEWETSARPDGTFEFEKIVPGRAVFRADPVRTEAMDAKVENRDLSGIVLTATTPQLFGQVEVEGGRRLPSGDSGSSVVHIEGREARGKTVPQQFIRSDGLFGLLPLPPGDYGLRFPRLPKGYSVKSISYAGTDLAQSPLKVVAYEPLPFIRVVLTPDAPVPPMAGAATLIVSKRGSGPIYMEGGFHYFSVRSTGKGDFRAEKRLGGEWYSERNGYMPAGASGSDSLAFSLPAGDYELSTYVRACDGNCNRLGGREDECRASFTIKSGETLFAERVQPAPVPRNRTCTLNLSPEPPK